MKMLTLDVEKLAVDSFEAGPADQDCPAVSAGATRTCPLDPAARP